MCYTDVCSPVYKGAVLLCMNELSQSFDRRKYSIAYWQQRWDLSVHQPEPQLFSVHIPAWVGLVKQPNYCLGGSGVEQP